MLHYPQTPLLHLSQFFGQDTHAELSNSRPTAHSVQDVISVLRQSEQDAEQPRHLLSAVKAKPLRHVMQAVALEHFIQFLIQVEQF